MDPARQQGTQDEARRVANGQDGNLGVIRHPLHRFNLHSTLFENRDDEDSDGDSQTQAQAQAQTLPQSLPLVQGPGPQPHLARPLHMRHASEEVKDELAVEVEAEARSAPCMGGASGPGHGAVSVSQSSGVNNIWNINMFPDLSRKQQQDHGGGLWKRLLQSRIRFPCRCACSMSLLVILLVSICLFTLLGLSWFLGLLLPTTTPADTTAPGSEPHNKHVAFHIPAGGGGSSSSNSFGVWVPGSSPALSLLNIHQDRYRQYFAAKPPQPQGGTRADITLTTSTADLAGWAHEVHADSQHMARLWAEWALLLVDEGVCGGSNDLSSCRDVLSSSSSPSSSANSERAREQARSMHASLLGRLLPDQSALATDVEHIRGLATGPVWEAARRLVELQSRWRAGEEVLHSLDLEWRLAMAVDADDRGKGGENDREKVLLLLRHDAQLVAWAAAGNAAAFRDARRALLDALEALEAHWAAASAECRGVLGAGRNGAHFDDWTTTTTTRGAKAVHEDDDDVDLAATGTWPAVVGGVSSGSRTAAAADRLSVGRGVFEATYWLCVMVEHAMPLGGRRRSSRDVDGYDYEFLNDDDDDEFELEDDTEQDMLPHFGPVLDQEQVDAMDMLAANAEDMLGRIESNLEAIAASKKGWFLTRWASRAKVVMNDGWWYGLGWRIMKAAMSLLWRVLVGAAT